MDEIKVITKPGTSTDAGIRVPTPPPMYLGCQVPDPFDALNRRSGAADPVPIRVRELVAALEHVIGWATDVRTVLRHLDQDLAVAVPRFYLAQPTEILPTSKP